MRINRYKTLLDENRIPVLVRERAVNYVDVSACVDPETVCNVANDVFSLASETEEHVLLFCLDTRKHLTGVFEVSHGTQNAALITPREIFMKALLCGAAGIILVHNHPNGDATPSEEDVKITKRVKEAGELLCVPLIDHIVIGSNTHFSLLEAGLM
ncbi:MAG: JAB domain-containing protein [Clostridiales bacterium]|nr:JAB domain-containing protein [Clostridiales bacterium]